MFRDLKKVEETNIYVDYAYGKEGGVLGGLIRVWKETGSAKKLKPLPDETEGEFRFFGMALLGNIEEAGYPDEFTMRIT
ncbi:MAG: hypothetical protein LBS85_00035 [Clostridiales Family XIII bacterium]|jgi:hypothetical protein|nr:hypothetical protein [Clostridiales Family XIII bacterium]